MSAEWESVLWWTMLSTGISAALVSVGASTVDWSKRGWPRKHQRFWLHVTSYGLFSMSVLAFVLRGLINPA
jgi:hypothetical protein